MAPEFNNAIPLLQVYDVPTSLAFYRDLLGFEVLQTSEPFDSAKDNFGWAMMRRSNVSLMLNNMYDNNQRPATPDALRARHHRDMTIYFSGDPDAMYAYLQAKGVAVQPPVNARYGMRQVSVSDPDGYLLVFQHPVDEP